MEDNKFLEIVRGNSVGKKYLLKGDRISIGSDSKAGLTVSGKHVSPMHAEIELQSDGNWVIQNKSPNGTFVNRNRISSHVLALGDVIQIGAETLIRLSQPEASKKSKRKDRAPAEKGAGILAKRPGLVIGGGIYLTVLVVLGIFLTLSDPTDKNVGPDWTKISKSIAQTEQTLKTNWQKLSHDSELTANAVVADEAGYFHVIVSEETTEVARERAISQLTDQLEAHMSRAWFLSQTGQLAAARVEYERALRLAPDLRLPSAWMAASQLSNLAPGEQ